MSSDRRNIASGHEIPREHYCDQPYVVQTNDGAWLCVMTTGGEEEGASGQHVIAVRSRDQGRTWSPPIDIEPPGPPEASYVTVLQTPSGRVYAFYNHNTDNLRTVIGHKNGQRYEEKRVDTLGYFVFKYSDDGGQTWSKQRYTIPIRPTQIDRENPYGGDVRFFWHVGKPLVHNGAAWVSLHKVGSFGPGFMDRSEGWFLRSDNLLFEPDPQEITWQTLPDGDIGLRAPHGPIADENKLVALSDGSLYCTYRTTDGHPCHAYSRDNGHTWTAPEYMTYTPGGRRVKHPRAANFVWRTSRGNFLYWFHNHGGKSYDDRNPAWLCGGVEKNGRLFWSQPEIALYDDDPKIRMSYPDLIEQDGRFFLTETQKTIARVHELDPQMLNDLWRQAELRSVAQEGLVLDVDVQQLAQETVAAPTLPDLSRGGFAIDLWFQLHDLAPGQTLLDARDAGGKGITVTTDEQNALAISMSDGNVGGGWSSDPDLLGPREQHHVVAIVDGGPKIITFVVDGTLCDGGTFRQYGWGRFPAPLGDVNGSETLSLGLPTTATLSRLRVYDRALRTSEAVGNFQAGD